MFCASVIFVSVTVQFAQPDEDVTADVRALRTVVTAVVDKTEPLYAEGGSSDRVKDASTVDFAGEVLEEEGVAVGVSVTLEDPVFEFVPEPVVVGEGESVLAGVDSGELPDDREGEVVTVPEPDPVFEPVPELVVVGEGEGVLAATA